MAPFYRGWISSGVKLERDDINAIQALYGKPKKSSNDDDDNDDSDIGVRIEDDVFKTEDKKPDSDRGSNNNGPLCSGSIDAIFGTEDENYYVFKGSQYWRILEEGVTDPRKISDDWEGLPNDIDAAVTWTTNGISFLGVPTFNSFLSDLAGRYIFCAVFHVNFKNANFIEIGSCPSLVWLP